MGDELGCLPGEHEIAGRVATPAAHGFERRRAVECAVDLGGGELRGVVREPAALRQLVGIKRAAPAVIHPAGCADANFADTSFAAAGVAHALRAAGGNSSGSRIAADDGEDLAGDVARA